MVSPSSGISRRDISTPWCSASLRRMARVVCPWSVASMWTAISLICRSAAVHNNVVGLEPFHCFADARLPFAIAHDIDRRTALCRQDVARHRSHHLANLAETVMAAHTMNGHTLHCHLVFDYFHPGKAVLLHRRLVLRLNIITDVFRQMLVQPFGYFTDGHGQMYTWGLIHADCRLHASLIGKERVDKDVVPCIIDSQGGIAHQTDSCFHYLLCF